MQRQQQQQQQTQQQQFQQQNMMPHQQAALQAAMINPAALSAIIQSQNPQLLHQIQHQQLQQLQQLHQQNLRLAAAFNQNQMGIYNATSALLNQNLPKQQPQQQHQQLHQHQHYAPAQSPNLDFENFPTREDYSPPPQHFVTPKCPKDQSKKEQNKDSAFDDISDDSSESTGSSYTSAELESHEIPDEATLEQICKQVEEYLSDEYLSTDKYLLRQLRSKSEGYLSVKLLTSFKKIKKLTRDWRVTAHALKRSTIVELSADGHRVKRHAHLPDNLRRGRTMTSILAIRVPEDWATLEAITNLFSAYGNITLARVLRPGRAIPPDLRNYATQIPDMGATTCAVVDFDSTDSAHECCRGLRDKNLRGMRIALLGPRIRRTLYKAEKKKVPENRHQRRQNASTTEQQQQQQQQPTAVSPPRKNVSKEEGSDKYHYYGVYRGLSITNLVARTRGHHDNTRSGLKIIQSYFNNNRTDDQLEFPPLGQAQQQQEQEQQPEAQQEWNLASQMKNMVVETKKPTMSEIVKSGESELNNSTTVDFTPDCDSSSTRDSPKPIGPVKSGLTLEEHQLAQCGEQMPDQLDVWSPWGSHQPMTRRASSCASLDDGFLELPAKMEKPIEKAEPLKFEPLMSLTSGIWSNSHTTETSGW